LLDENIYDSAPGKTMFLSFWYVISPFSGKYGYHPLL
jgi:hypothetical protein